MDQGIENLILDCKNFVWEIFSFCLFKGKLCLLRRIVVFNVSVESSLDQGQLASLCNRL